MPRFQSNSSASSYAPPLPLPACFLVSAPSLPLLRLLLIQRLFPLSAPPKLNSEAPEGRSVSPKFHPNFRLTWSSQWIFNSPRGGGEPDFLPPHSADAEGPAVISHPGWILHQWAAVLHPVGRASKQCSPFSSTGPPSVRRLSVSAHTAYITSRRHKSPWRPSHASPGEVRVQKKREKKPLNPELSTDWDTLRRFH